MIRRRKEGLTGKKKKKKLKDYGELAENLMHSVEHLPEQ
jgi:hypothetical protein